jgi:hypothetical protein
LVHVATISDKEAAHRTRLNGIGGVSVRPTHRIDGSMVPNASSGRVAHRFDMLVRAGSDVWSEMVV